jgi:hypothetical protein
MMKKLIVKLAIFLLPVVSLIVFYLVSDPFKVIYHYDQYYYDNKPWGIALNKDVISVESFLNHRSQCNYDSYIFGNSRSMFYRAASWKEYIGGNAKVFHFDANSETLYGIYRKIRLIDSVKAPLQNALIIFDESVLYQAGNSEGHLFVKDYNLSGQSWYSFQMIFFKDYLMTPKFISAYLDYKITGRLRPYMFRGRILSNILINYDGRLNEVSFKAFDDSIMNHREAYYSNKKEIFFDRDAREVFSKPVIHSPQLAQLECIRDILKKNATKYKIVISPLYDQKRISPHDLNILQQCFGVDNVYDFSGINKYTADKTNYYESSHYRPPVAADILRQIYGQGGKYVE